MAARIFRLIAGAVCHLLLCWSLVYGQQRAAPGQPERGDQPPSKRPQSALPPVEESRPVLYYLKDKQGELVPVPGFTYEEFEQLYKLKEKLAQPDQRPRYVLQSLSASGTAGARHAELTVRVQVLVREEGWVRVPLGFDRAFLGESAEYKGPGEGFVHFEDGGQGYVGWIRGPAGKPHELRLKLLVPLVDVGDETRMKLLAPRATVSRLKLKAPVPKAVGKVSQGAGLLTSAAAGNGATEFTVLGLGGDFELTWRRPGRQPAEQPTVLEAEGTVLARIDARGVDTEATLKVRGSGAPFDRFRVRLPLGASLVPRVPVSSNGYSVSPVQSDEGAAAGHALVEIRLTEKKSGPVEVRLATWRPHELNQPEEWFELGGFEVVGAARQWGHVDVAADSDWQVLWGSSRGVRRVEPLPLEDVVAGFDYYAQPYSLTARLVPKKTRISVEPEYRLLVDADRVQLKATLKYTIRGAKAFKLDVALPVGWESVQLEPQALVAVDGISVTNGNVLSIPLLQPSTGKMDLHISAQWPIPEDSSALVLPFPQPEADWPGPAAVAVVPADNVQLVPNHESIVGLLRQPVSLAMELPDRQQPPLFYRGEAAEAVFAAEFSVHAQRIAAEVTSLVSLDEPPIAATSDLPFRWAGKVHQKLAYRIDYEPADHLIIQVPPALTESGQLELQCDGQPLTPVLLPGNPNPQDTSEPVRMQIDLPKPCIGACELEVRYPIQLGELIPGVTQLVDQKPVVLPLPLVMPDMERLSSNKLHVSTPPEVEVRLSDDARAVWEEERQEPGSPPGLQLSTDQPTPQVELEIELDEEQGTTVVERAWVQTWLIASTRRDRALFCFTSDQKELALVLPAGVAMDRVQVLLDDKPVAGQPDDEGRLIIPLPSVGDLRSPTAWAGDTSQDPHLLELRSESPRGRQPPGRLAIELPRLGDDVPVYEMYWQLVLPWNEHLIATPKGLTNEFTWQWAGYFWGRKPVLDQSQLEAWARLEPPPDGSQKRLAPHGTNCYLFSSLGNVDRCELRTAWRSWLLLSASGVALAAGLTLIYVPLTRHPVTLFVAAIVLLCVGILYYPEPAFLLAQAASLGLGLALVAGLLERSVARRRRATALLETPSAILEKASTQTHYPVPTAGTDSSTQTAPTIVPPPTPDSNA